MASNISFPTIPQHQPYCQISDVMALIGNVEPISDGTISTDQIQTAIVEATAEIENQTSNFFSPRRTRNRLDGNGHSRMVLPYSHVLWVNNIDVYFVNPEPLQRIAFDYSLITDYQAGIVSFPEVLNTPLFSQLSFTFFKGSRNVSTDVWYGWSREVYGETLTSTDNITYSFANPTAVPKTLVPSMNGVNAPVFGPVVYINGVQQVNSTYVLGAVPNVVTISTPWEIASDNLVYTLNVSPNGITGITFNESQDGNEITVDYDYWYIPVDIAEACAKKASSDLLTAISTATFDDLQFQGAVEIVMDTGRIQYQGGQWGNILDRWDTEIQNILKKHTRIPYPYGVGFVGGR